jgi:hypothetical protein
MKRVVGIAAAADTAPEPPRLVGIEILSVQIKVVAVACAQLRFPRFAANVSRTGNKAAWYGLNILLQTSRLVRDCSL